MALALIHPKRRGGGRTLTLVAAFLTLLTFVLPGFAYSAEGSPLLASGGPTSYSPAGHAVMAASAVVGSTADP